MQDPTLLREMLSKLDKRGISFAIMLDHLSAIKNPTIIETGCARKENNFDGDGMSTLIFDEYIKQYGGEFYSVDINPDNVKFVKERCANTFSYCSDSVKFLNNINDQFAKQNRFVDLLYLDSFDLDIDNPHPSSLHHMFELAAIMPSLKKGTMIVVDDNIDGFIEGTEPPQAVTIGKGDYVDQYFKLLGIEKVFKGYQWVWKI
jgi:hypothetical protein